MRKIVLFLTVILLSVSCKKSKPEGSSVEYKFTSDVSASYKIEYSSGVDMLNTETFQGISWSKTVILNRNPDFANITTARLVVYPPSTWPASINSAHVNLKILVDGIEKVNTDTVLTNGSVFQLYTF